MMTKIHELHESTVSRLIEQALFEDLGFGDVTAEILIPDDRLVTAHFISEENGVVSGLEIGGLVYRYLDMQITFSSILREGDSVKKEQTIAHVHGPASGIMRGKQTVLNFLTRMSGIATLTRKYADQTVGTKARIVASKYTIPTLRMIDYSAVKAGGGLADSFGSDEEIVITAPHVMISGNLTAAVKKALEYGMSERINKPVSVEVKSFEELKKIIRFAGKLNRIILSGFPPNVIPQAVEAVDGQSKIEASGGITRENVREVAKSGVDYIRIPELTQSSKALSVNFRISP